MGPLALVGAIVGIIAALIGIGVAVQQLIAWIHNGTGLDEILDEVSHTHPSRVRRRTADRAGHTFRQYTVYPRTGGDDNNCIIVEEERVDSWVIVRVENGIHLRSRPATRSELIHILQGEGLHSLLQRQEQPGGRRYA
ncbi:MAG TPA: hypothetical protein PKY50_11115 [Candidatus Competibacter sp.]|nr:hypothetical protein [Candidatus Competibacter sp.]